MYAMTHLPNPPQASLIGGSSTVQSFFFGQKIWSIFLSFFFGLISHAVRSCLRELARWMCGIAHSCMCHVTFATPQALFVAFHIFMMLLMNESCHIWMSHVTYELFMPHMNEPCHVWMSHVTYKRVMSHTNESRHILMSHVTHEWVMSHTNESRLIQMSHVIYKWVTSCMNESCQIWMSHIIYERVTSYLNA